MIEPGSNNPRRWDAKRLEEIERNVFFHTLAPLARERFLEALSDAEERGLDDQAAWEEAVIAAETAYSDEEKV